MEFISYFEKQIDLVISQSVKELDKKNRLFEIQGLKQKQRIDQSCIREAIKTISNKRVFLFVRKDRRHDTKSKEGK